MTLAAGLRLGPYEILAALGAGGMGEVYRARDTRLEREVALKVLPAATRTDADARARFRREALALSRLNHPNIETVYDFGEDAGVDYLVLEFVPGETLGARLVRGRVPEREATDLGAQVAEALAEAHERGVLHRDLKPANIMVTPKGRVKVLDFGLAKLAQAPGEITPTMAVTMVGTTTGTLAYMAPEQLLGETVDARADLYALGVVLYEMVAGKRPFEAALSTALSNQILHGALVAPRAHAPDLSAHLDAVVLRALERDCARRYQTAGEMVGELRRLATGGAEAAVAGDAASPSGGFVVPSRGVTSIAVLPLENLSGDPAQEYFSDGMTEELIATLAQVRALRIISRTSVMRFKGQHRSITEIARELNVDAVVEGSVRRAGERVRITVQLIEAATERHLWAKSYERDLTEVLALQGEVAAAIVAEIQVTVTPQEATLLNEVRAIVPEAYEAFLKGRYHIERRTEENLRQGLASLHEAVRLDPTLVPAHVGVADAYNLMGFMSVVAPREAFPRAMAAARRALEIEPSCAEALTSLAYGTLWYEWNRAESERLFRKSIDLDPKYSQAHLWFANECILSGRFDEARVEANLARTLDPLSNVAIAFRGWFPYWRGQFEAAVRGITEAAELIPDFAPVHYWHGVSLMRTGRDAAAIAALERCIALLGRTPMAISAVGTAHALAGRAGDARAVLDELVGQATHRFVGGYYPAQILVALGDFDAAFAALDHAVEERVHWLAGLRIDPSLAPLRSDPRFSKLVARVEGVS